MHAQISKHRAPCFRNPGFLFSVQQAKENFMGALWFIRLGGNLYQNNVVNFLEQRHVLTTLTLNIQHFLRSAPHPSPFETGAKTSTNET